MAMMEAGTYQGTTVAASIFEAPSGAVMCSMVVDVNGSHLKGGICLVQKDGTLSERGFKDVQEIFGWNEWDWAKWDAEPEAFAGFPVQTVVEVIQGERGAFAGIKYINPPGGGQRLEKANAKALAAKYGAKTRALFGGSPAPGGVKPFDAASASARGNGTTADMQGRSASAARPSAPRTAAPPPPAPPAAGKPFDAAQGKPSTMEECWDAFCRENPGKPERELYARWAQEITRVTGKGQNDCTPEDWGLVLADFSQGMLPF